MFSSIWLGFAAIGAVLYYGVFHGFNQGLGVFMNSHALILVFGGTAAVALFSYRLNQLAEGYRFFIFGFVLKRKTHVAKTALELLKCIKDSRQPGYDLKLNKPKHPFVFDSLRVLVDPSLSTLDADVVLQSIRDGFHKRYLEQAKMILNLSKFPPALGLLGASTGMIQMMMNLGKGGTEAIGAAMAVALTATFWGIGFANFILLPLADFAFQSAEDDVFLREMISDGVLLAKEGVELKVVAESVANRLPVQDRFMVLKEFAKLEAPAPQESGDNVIPFRSDENDPNKKSA